MKESGQTFLTLTMYYGQYRRRKFSLILTGATTKWPKNYQSAMKRQKFYGTVRTQPNQTEVCVTVYLFVRETGPATWSAESRNIIFLRKHREINIVITE